jgi:hypothetical protein
MQTPTVDKTQQKIKDDKFHQGELLSYLTSVSN